MEFDLKSFFFTNIFCGFFLHSRSPNEAKQDLHNGQSKMVKSTHIMSSGNEEFDHYYQKTNGDVNPRVEQNIFSTLRGPFSPIESSIYPIKHPQDSAAIDQLSINSILLNADKQVGANSFSNKKLFS